MKLCNKKTFMLMSFLTIILLTSSFSSVGISVNNKAVSFNDQRSLKLAETNNITIRIALYPPLHRSAHGDTYSIVFNYTWKSGEKVYRFTTYLLNVDELRGGGERPLNRDNFDLLVVSVNYFSYTIHGLNPKIVKNIKDFLSEGGGYLGICGGPTFASLGFEKPKNIYERWTNKGVLGILNVYLNQGLFTEMQYCMRAIGGLPSIQSKIERDNDNPIFDTYAGNFVNFTYGGGPACYYANKTDDPKLGELVSILTFSEELMDTYPLHNWKKKLIGWKPEEVIKTDYKGLWNGIASTYNNSGRIVVFGSHPEIPLHMNATVKEVISKRSKYSSLGLVPLPCYILEGGEYFNISYNFWVHRRAAAWIAGVPDEDLPPNNELMVYLNQPQFRTGNQFYLNGSIIGAFFNFSLLNPPFDFPIIENSWILSRIFGRFVSKRLAEVVEKTGLTIIVGDITVLAYAEGSDIVEFYIDDELKYVANNRSYINPYTNESFFEWKMDENNLKGVHRLEVRAYDSYGNYCVDGSEFLFYNT